MARPSKLSDATTAAVAGAVEQAASFRAAAIAAGLSEATFHSWMARGRVERGRLEAAQAAVEELPQRPRSKAGRAKLKAALGAAKPIAAEQPFLEFLERIEAADAAAQVAAAGHISTAGADEWRASAWLLERRDPKTFGPPVTPLEHRGSETAPIVAVDARDAESRRLAHQLLARAAGRGTKPN